MKQKFKELKVNDRVKTLHSGMATVVGYNGGTMVKLDCDVKKWNCPYFYEHELDFSEQDVDEQDVQQETLDISKYTLGIDPYDKQETLNEVAERFIPQSDKWTIKEIFIEGAKWQQERSYSEEEVKFIISEALESVLVNNNLELWFNIFKKK